jgi:hypothetical protein
MQHALALRRCPAWILVGAPLLACQIEVESPPEDPQGSRLDAWPEIRMAPVPPPPPYGYPASTAVPEEPTLPPQMYRDLIVLDPAVVNGPLADSTRPDAPFSFRAQMQWLAGAGREPFDFTRSWLDSWAEATSVGPSLAPVTPRPAARALLMDPWLGAGADAGYAALPSWERVPFRLIAIVNRVDLAADPCSGSAGELRYVYSAVEPSTGQALDMTVILEVPYPRVRPAAAWARAWSELANLPSTEEYVARLSALAREVQLEGDPLRVRLRSNELALANADSPTWELREFQLQIQSARLSLVQVPLEFTPRSDVDPALLAEHVLEHAQDLRTSGVSLPEAWRAGAAEISDPGFSWPVLGVSERLRQTFSTQTCNGCHGGDTASLPFQHIQPATGSAGPARLSRFLYDPNADMDELRRRELRLGELRSSACAAPEPELGYPGE